MEDNIIIRHIAPDEMPMELVYEVDESPQSVADYIQRGMPYAAFSDRTVVGEYVLLHTRPFTAEIVNIAVAPAWRGRGIGKLMVGHAIETAREMGLRILQVGTGNAGTGQMAFYQKCGFTMTHIDHGYISRLYPDPIIENGIPCRDMVRMQMYL